MGMPELDISGSEYEFVSGLVGGHGRRLDADPYEVTLSDGSREVVALGASTIHGREEFLDGLRKLLDGGGLFGKQEAIDLDAVSPDTSLKDFLGNPRVAGVLSRHADIRTIGDLLVKVANLTTIEELDEIRGIGPDSVAVIRTALGR